VPISPEFPFHSKLGNKNNVRRDCHKPFFPEAARSAGGVAGFFWLLVFWPGPWGIQGDGYSLISA
jgi:hypothetical protein